MSSVAYNDFLTKWRTKFGGVPPSGFHAFAYDDTNILLDIIEKVAVVDEDGTIHFVRQALRDAITDLKTTKALLAESIAAMMTTAPLGLPVSAMETAPLVRL